MTYIKENIITKLQELYNPPRNHRAINKFPVLFEKKPLCTGNLSPACKIFTGKLVYVTAVLAGNGPFLAKKHHTQKKKIHNTAKTNYIFIK